MTNTIAIWLGLFILGAIGLDLFLFGSEHMVFLGKKFVSILEYLAFWR